MKMQFSPQVGDVCFCHLPEEGFAKQAKLRPVIILDAAIEDGIQYLTVAKGTSQNIDKCYLGEFVVTSSTDLRVCGLVKPTKFQLNRIEKLPLSDQWFEGKIGSLPTTLHPALVRAAQETGLI